MDKNTQYQFSYFELAAYLTFTLLIFWTVANRDQLLDFADFWGIPHPLSYAGSIVVLTAMAGWAAGSLGFLWGGRRGFRHGGKIGILLGLGISLFSSILGALMWYSFELGAAKYRH